MPKVSFTLFCLSLLVIGSCARKTESLDPLKDFDGWAIQHLKRPLNLNGFGKRDSCNLTKLLSGVWVDSVAVRAITTTNPVILFWPYFIKNYFVSEIELHFSIIKDRYDTTHFFHHNELRTWIYDSNKKYESGDYEFNDKTYSGLRLKEKISVVRLSTSELDFLLKDPYFNTLDDFEEHNRRLELLNIVETIFNPFVDKIGFELIEEYLELNKEYVSHDCSMFIKRIKSNLVNYNRLGVYEIKHIGYLIFDPGDKEKKFEINFIPFYERPLVLKNDFPYLYNDCDQLKY